MGAESGHGLGVDVQGRMPPQAPQGQQGPQVLTAVREEDESQLSMQAQPDTDTAPALGYLQGGSVPVAFTGPPVQAQPTQAPPAEPVPVAQHAAPAKKPQAQASVPVSTDPQMTRSVRPPSAVPPAPPGVSPLLKGASLPPATTPSATTPAATTPAAGERQSGPALAPPASAPTTRTPTRPSPAAQQALAPEEEPLRLSWSPAMFMAQTGDLERAQTVRQGAHRTLVPSAARPPEAMYGGEVARPYAGEAGRPPHSAPVQAQGAAPASAAPSSYYVQSGLRGVQALKQDYRVDEDLGPSFGSMFDTWLEEHPEARPTPAAAPKRAMAMALAPPAAPLPFRSEAARLSLIHI